MAKRRSLGKRVALACGVLAGVLVVAGVVAYFVLNSVGQRRVDAALARIRASGAPTTWEEVIPPPIPEDENAAVLYEKAVALIALTKPDPPRPKYPPYPYPDSSDRSHPLDVLADYLSAATREQRKALEPAMAQILADNAPALSYAKQAAGRAKCRFDGDYTDPPETLPLPLHRVRLQDLSRLASARAILQADRGDLPAALEAWALPLRMVEHLESEPTLLRQGERCALLADAADSLQRILRDNRPDPEWCRLTADRLAHVNLEAPFVRVLESRRVEDILLRERLRSDPDRYLLPSLPDTTEVAAMRLGYRFVGALDEAFALRRWEQYMSLADKPYREACSSLDAIARAETPRYAYVTLMMEPVLAGVWRARDVAAARLALVQAALGLAAYRQRFDEYPQTLDQLRRALTWPVPQDPLSGKDLVYRRDGPGYLLYSVGPNLSDDAGTPVRSGSLRDDGDIVWRIER